MARSPFTLAASVISALPGADVVGAAELTERADGRYDSALVTLRDGSRVVVRVPVDQEADTELVAEARALGALTPGVRAQLPFTAPTVLGSAPVDGVTAIVQDYLEGYRVDAAHVPPGRGIAVALGAAIARVHALPTAVAQQAGLPARTSTQVREDAERLLDRAEATGKLPFGLLRRWSTVLGTERLWRFETTLVLGGIDPGRFVFVDVDGEPAVTALLSWHGLSVSDPAQDLRWIASAPTARDDVLASYIAAAAHAPDTALAARARLYAELEFARWLAHGHETGSEQIVADAVALLTSLDEGVRDEPFLVDEITTVDDALEILGRVPDTTQAANDTSMQTDTYDPAALTAFLADEGTAAQADIETVPIDLGEWTPDGGSEDHRPAPSTGAVATNATGTRDALSDTPTPAASPADTAPDDTTLEDTDPAHTEAARNTLRRWSVGD